MKNLLVSLAVITSLSSCTFMGQERSPAERVLLVCEGWAAAFQKVTLRRQFDLATEEEIDSVNVARPILNPLCETDPAAANLITAQTAEDILLAVVLARKAKENAGSSN